MGGGPSRFPSTSLSWFLSDPAASVQGLAERLEKVVATYWRPIYFYIRRGWSKSDADAKDLTQSFLIHVLEHDLLGRFDRRRGNFRTYLKRCLQSFLGTAERDASRLKRGGGRPVLPLLDGPVEVPAGAGTPDEQFDRDWAREVLMRCLRDVEAHFRDAGEPATYAVFRAYVLEADAQRPPSYRDVGATLGLTEMDVRSRLRTARQELRRRVIQAASEYVVDEQDIFAEMSGILGEP